MPSAAGASWCMGDPERLGLVHPAMRPVETGVLHDEVDQHRKRMIPPRQGGKISGDLGPPAMLPDPQHNARRGAVNRGRNQRPAHFSDNLAAAPGIQPRPHPRRSERKQPAGQQISQRDNCRNGKAHNHQRKRNGQIGRQHCVSLCRKSACCDRTNSHDQPKLSCALHSGSTSATCRRNAIRANCSTSTLRRAAASGASAAGRRISAS